MKNHSILSPKNFQTTIVSIVSIANSRTVATKQRFITNIHFNGPLSDRAITHDLCRGALLATSECECVGLDLQSVVCSTVFLYGDCRFRFPHAEIIIVLHFLSVLVDTALCSAT